MTALHPATLEEPGRRVNYLREELACAFGHLDEPTLSGGCGRDLHARRLVVAPMAAPAQPAVSRFSGGLLFRAGPDLWRVDLTTGEQRVFLRPERGYVMHAAYSSDRRNLAYSVNVTDDQTNRLQSSDVIIADADGRNGRTVAHEEDGNYTVGAASWPAERGG